VVAAFLGTSLVGGLLLRLPMASEPGESSSFVTAWFTATSAVCVTGLNVVDPESHWSLFGELVILALIQIGGFGIIALSSLLVALLARRLGLRHRLIAVAETGAIDMSDVRRLLLSVAKLTAVFELTAAAILTIRWATTHGEPIGRAAYLGIFHSVSSFNNAGFALFFDNLISYRTDPVILLVIAANIVIGGLGLPVWSQIGRNRQRAHAYSLHAKLTLSTTGALILGGALLFAWFEWTNPATLGGLGWLDSVTNSIFHSITPRTAGFNSMDIAELREPSRLLTEVLMFIGGGSASTAGGIKVTTFAVLLFILVTELRGEGAVNIFGKRLSRAVHRQAITVVLIAVAAVITGTALIMFLSGENLDKSLFETISAFATVGMSTGITAALPESAQVVLIILMFLGRIGPLTLGSALALRERRILYELPKERPAIG